MICRCVVSWIGVLLCTLLFSCYSYPQVSQSQVESIFIPAGQLDEALNHVSSVYKISIIADATFIRPFKSEQITGRFTLAKLIESLIASHPIIASFTAAGVVLKAKPPQFSGSDSQHLTQQTIEKFSVLGSKPTSFSANADLGWRESNQLQSGLRNNTGNFISSVNRAGLTALPAQNLAEAFGHLSGLTISRDFGEGLSVSARGLGPSYQSILLNGHPMANNENMRDSGQSGRKFRFDVLSAQSMQRVDILKTPSLAMSESGIGATIALQSLRPLQIKQKLTSTNIGLDYAEHSDRSSQSANFLSNWLNLNETAGILITASTKGRNIRQDHFQTWNWEPNGNSYRLAEVQDMVLLPSNRIAVTLENETRRTNSFSISAQWQPNRSVTLTADQFISALSMDYTEQRLLARLDSGGEFVNGTQIENNSLLAAKFDSMLMRSALDISTQKHINATSMLAMTFSQNDWDLDFSFAKTRANSSTAEPIRRTRMQTVPVAFEYSVAGGVDAAATFAPSPFPTFDTTNVAIQHMSARDIQLQDNGNSLRLTIQKGLTYKNVTQIKGGLNWREQHRGYRRQDTHVSQQQLANTLIQTEYIDRVDATDFLKNSLANSLPDYWHMPSSIVQMDASDRLMFGAMTAEDFARSYQTKEQLNSAYLATDFSFDLNSTVYGEAGIRWKQWQNSVSGFYADLHDVSPSFRRFVSKQNYWLPSVNLRTDISDSWLVKMATGKAISLPSYADMQPGLSINTTEGVYLAAGGNPKLLPVRSTYTDIGILWSGQLANIYLGAFFRKLNDFIGVTPQQIVVEDQTYQLSKPSNLSSFNIKGLELDMSYQFNQHFGLQLNGMWLDGAVLQTELEAVAKWNYKVQTYFESKKFSARLALDRQSDYLFVRSATQVPNTHIAGQTYLSAQLTYRVSKNIKLNFSGRNLLAKPTAYYFDHQGGKILKELEYVGRSYTLDVDFSF